MTDKRVVLTTASSSEEARRIAHALVVGKLAACVNIVPGITSIYRWKDKVEEAEEVVLIIKTTEAAFAGVRETIASMHSYEVPECIALAIEAGSPPYLTWISASVS